MIDAPGLIAMAELEFDQGNVELAHQSPGVARALALATLPLLQDNLR